MNKNRLMPAALLAMSVAFTLSACGNSDDQASPETPTETTREWEPGMWGPDNEGNTPGAMVGNNQRTWPDPRLVSDDSAHVTPGEYSVDVKGNPVWTPDNHDGDLPRKSDIREGFEQCENPAEIELEGLTQQQYVNGRYLIVNEFAGPTKMEDGVPLGFAHSPQGAVTLALNLLTYALPAQGDGIGEEIDATYWTTYETAQEEREFKGLNREDYDHTEDRALLSPGPDFYRVASCSENVVVVEIGFDSDSDGTPPQKGEVPLFWREGEWEVDLSGAAATRFDNLVEFDPAADPVSGDGLHKAEYR